MEKKLDIIPYSGWGLFGKDEKPLLIAGPCSAESEEQVMETARQLKEMGVTVFRAGIWKPRTHPNTFEGVGTPGLKWLQRVKRELGMKVCTEVASEKHIFDCIKHGIDMIWVGARTSANPFLMQDIADALADVDIPVLVKNPVNPDLELWIGALERLNQAGVRKLGVIHRGCSSSEKMLYRNSPEWKMAVDLKSRIPDITFICDPSHMAGKRAYIQEISQRSLDLGFDGLMIESHCDPSCALSDAAQQFTPAQLAEMMSTLKVPRSSADLPEYRESMEQLRAKIDVLDENLLFLLSSRMKICREIGQFKKDNSISIIQSGRWDSLLADKVAKGKAAGLHRSCVETIFNAIHKESVRLQDDIVYGLEPDLND